MCICEGGPAAGCSGRSAGTVASRVEVTNIARHGFRVLVVDQELAVPYAQFPWFKKAAVGHLSDVQRPTENHLHWPQLDVDLSVESIRKPDAFPLVSGA
jgi:hypothetical protein